MINFCIAGETATHYHSYFTGYPGNCTTDDDCRPLENSYCDKQRCACQNGFIFVANNTRCLSSKIFIILNIVHKVLCSADKQLSNFS